MDSAFAAGLADICRDRAALRDFVDVEVLPNAVRYETAQSIPREMLDRLGDLGVWAAMVPADAGGAGLDMPSFVTLHEEIGRGSSSLRGLLTVHSMVCWSVTRWGNAQVRQRWLGPLARGTILGSFCLTEPAAGSNAAAVTTTASRSADGWVLNGRKRWITGGQVAGLFLVFARTERGISAFLVPRDAPGLRATAVGDLLGTRASMMVELNLDECRVGSDALLGPDGFGLQSVLAGALDIGRLSVAAGCVGILQACLDASLEHSAKRNETGAALSDHQLVRRMVTDMYTSTEAARLLCERAARLKESADPGATTAILMAKYFASTAAMRSATDAVQIHGAAGCADHSTVAMHFKDAKIMEIIEGSSEIQQVVIADAAFRGRRAR